MHIEILLSDELNIHSATLIQVVCPLELSIFVTDYVHRSLEFSLTNSKGKATLRTDFDNFQSQLNRLDVKAVVSFEMEVTVISSLCKSNLIDSSDFSTNFTSVSVPPDRQDLIDNGV